MNSMETIRPGRRSLNECQDLREARRKKGWTQVETAEKLGVTQAYLSMLERGRRTLPLTWLAWQWKLSTLPRQPCRCASRPLLAPVQSEKLSLQLAALGYPGFAHLRAKAQRNPARFVDRTKCSKPR